jgi:uncharacterized Zn finger protein
MEERFNIRQEEVAYICDTCGKGEMIPTGECLTSFPPQYPHKCNACGAIQTFSNITYPYVATHRLIVKKI